MQINCLARETLSASVTALCHYRRLSPGIDKVKGLVCLVTHAEWSRGYVRIHGAAKSNNDLLRRVRSGKLQRILACSL